MPTTDQYLADQLSEFYADPLGFVMFVFPWDSDPALQVVDWESETLYVDERTGFVTKTKTEHCVTYKEAMAPYRKRFNSRYGPDKWACEFLDGLGEEIKKRKFDGSISVAPVQCATASGHGIGKSVLVAWLVLFIMATRPYSRGVVTANTAEQLRTKTWAELGKWHRRSIIFHWFKYNSGRGNMSLKHTQHEGEWYCSAQTCREENSEAFAGQHAVNATSFYIFDEASAVPNKIYEVREGGTTDGEPMVFDFGNPTRNSGRFFDECEGKLRRRYIVRKIDSRSVFITNKERIGEWAEDYGEDSDFFKVRVKGEFPSSGSLQFMPSSWVKRAMLREVPHNRFAPLTLGVDVARFGDDDSIIYPALGNDLRSFCPKQGDGIYNGLDNVQLAQKVIQKILWFENLGLQVSAVFVDVGGLGAGVVDVLNHSGWDHVTVPVNFGNTPVFEPEIYRYRSDEMWGRGKTAIRDTWALPRLLEFQNHPIDQEEAKFAQRLYDDLTQREFGYTLQGNKISLESKKDMKARGLVSPDSADAAFLNKAQDVAALAVPHGEMQNLGKTDCDFDPMAGASLMGV